jgi:hypothetical protein
MNHRRIAAATATVWLVSIPIGAVIHHGVLGSVYAANAAAFRPDTDVVQRLPIGYAGLVLGFWAAAVMYAKTSPRSSSILGGIQFGLLIGADRRESCGRLELRHAADFGRGWRRRSNGVHVLVCGLWCNHRRDIPAGPGRTRSDAVRIRPCSLRRTSAATQVSYLPAAGFAPPKSSGARKNLPSCTLPDGAGEASVPTDRGPDAAGPITVEANKSTARPRCESPRLW